MGILAQAILAQKQAYKAKRVGKTRVAAPDLIPRHGRD